MKTLIIILFILISIVTSAQEIYNFNLKDVNNKTAFYNDLRGDRFTVIDFWATWCKPCLNSLPKIVTLADTFKTKGVKFIGISVDGPRNWSKIKPFTESLGINYPILIDKDQAIMTDLNISSIPTLIIADENNRIVYYHEGFSLGDEKIIEKELNKLLQNNK